MPLPFEQLPIFEGLDARHLRTLAQLAEQQRFAAGEVMIEDGAENNTLFIVTEGTVGVLYGGTKKLEDVIKLEAGSAIGELSFIDGAPAWHTVQAYTDVYAICFEHGELRELFEEAPEIGYRMMSRLARDVAGRLRHTERLYFLSRRIL